MNQWSRNRKRIILALIFFVLVVLVGAPIFFLFYQAPTCSDGRLNGDETGVDCGGSCQLLCSAESLPLILKGDPRVLEVTSNTFEVVALIENPNISAGIYRAGYTLKLYDASSTIPLKTIEGETHVPKGATFTIFEGPFTIEDGTLPTRATFEWKQGTLQWQKSTTQMPEILVKDSSLSREDTSPRLDASIENASLENVSNIDLTALISNESGNIFAASKTFVDTLSAGEKSPIVFTWPRPFGEKAVSINIIVRILPDRSFIR
ncbi:MAG: hypothetical protein Q8P17_05360 [bacterium]|nr:hypothetical protein [bacterium]